jgi:hypothetical protein
MVDVEAIGGGDAEVPMLLLRSPGREPLAPTTIREGMTTTYRFRTPDGVPPGTTMFAQRFVMLSRVLGFEPPGEGIDAWPGPVSRPVLVTTETLCDRRDSR